MNAYRSLERILAEGNNKVTIEKLSARQQFSLKSWLKLENEIAEQIKVNEVMRNKSAYIASHMYYG